MVPVGNPARRATGKIATGLCISQLAVTFWYLAKRLLCKLLGFGYITGIQSGRTRDEKDCGVGKAPISLLSQLFAAREGAPCRRVFRFQKSITALR
jgi:hypothetical protein